MLKKELKADKVDISTLNLVWHDGPVLQLGEISLSLPGVALQQVKIELSFPLFQLFRGEYAPELTLVGGEINLDLNVESEHPFSAPNIWLSLHHVDIHWVYAEHAQVLVKSNIRVSPFLSFVSLKSKGLQLVFGLNDQRLLKSLALQMDDLSVLPPAWSNLLPNASHLSLKLNLLPEQQALQHSWSWQTSLQAKAGGKLDLPAIHIDLPFVQFLAQGELSLSSETPLKLLNFAATSLKWDNKQDFVNAKLSWVNNILHIGVMDGSASMPMLWSWLWMLGEDDFQQWLGLMKHGRLEQLQATLDLPWASPLHTSPTDKDWNNMTYDVRTHVRDADIALGNDGDFLWHTDADVVIDQNHLTAHMNSTDLDQQSGNIQGDFSIDWESLMMHITGKGVVDVGKLHAWLDKDAAQDLHWGKAPAFAELNMDWDVDEEGPEKGLVHLRPKGSWSLRPYDIPLTTRQGVAIWDVNLGLTIHNMQAHSPWLDGKVSMFLDSKDNWSLQSLQLHGHAALAQLTQQFSLPIVQPVGETQLDLQFADATWQGKLDFSQSAWSGFLGLEKSIGEAFAFDFSGTSQQSSLYPIHLTQLSSTRADFQLGGSIKIHSDKLEFHFKDMNTPAFIGHFRLHLPLDESLPWGMEVDADLVKKSAFAMYFHDHEVDADSTQEQRPWSVFADVKRLEWEKSFAESAHVQFASDTTSVGEFSAEHLSSGDIDLQQVSSSFTMLEHGKFDLHLLDAKGSGQHLRVSGSVQPMKDGVLQWQGLALMDGQFGTLMQQAELDKLFQHGEMTAIFLGKGEFKEGEAWFRGMQGRFRLLVKDGRMMQGGTLTRLLAAISLVDLPKYLIFQRDDVLGDGLLYEKMQIEANFDEEKLQITELAFRSSALDAGGKGVINLDSGELDLLLIARPWQNMESLLGNIPLLGYVLTGKDKSLLRKVYRIEGPASDAEVREVQPEDAGLPRSGLLEHLFSLPSQWFGD